MRNILLAAAAILPILSLPGCDSAADKAAHNVSRAADNFEIVRRVIFYNGITDRHILTIEGLCSLGNYDNSRRMSVTCRTGPNEYKRHFLGLSDNVTFFAEQLEAAQANVYMHRVILNPLGIIPTLELR